MSLISEALRKADSPSPSAGQPSSGPSGSDNPKWLSGAAVLAAVGLLIFLLPRSANHATGPNASAPTVSAALAPSKPKLGLNLLRSAESQWRLSGVISGGGGKPVALINQRVVEEGEMIGGARVVQISQDEVELESEGQIRTLRLQ